MTDKGSRVVAQFSLGLYCGKHATNQRMRQTGVLAEKRRVDRWTPCLPPFLVFHFQIPNLSRLLHLVNFVNVGKFFWS